MRIVMLSKKDASKRDIKRTLSPISQPCTYTTFIALEVANLYAFHHVRYQLVQFG